MHRQCLIVFLLLCSSYVYAQPNASIVFIENKNQWPSNVDYAAKVGGVDMRVGPGYFAYQLLDQRHLEAEHLRTHFHSQPDGVETSILRGHYVLEKFIGANLNARPLPFGRTDEHYNFYLGNDRSKWAGKVSGYQGFYYPEIYKGVTLKVYSSGDNVKYDFILSPYADPSQIVLQYEGAEDLSLQNGNLYVKTSVGDIIEKRPIAYQVIDGAKKMIEVEYNLDGNVLTFCFQGEYDPCRELVIDPLLIFSTYSGSTADNWGSTATPGEHGNLYSAGVTTSSLGGQFPATPGAFQTINKGDYDIGILKYDSLGKKLLYATYLGGASAESPHSLVMNSNEELILLGTTSSANFPTSAKAFQKNFAGGEFEQNVIFYPNGSDIFLARFSKDGSMLLASTYLGGSANDGLNMTNTALVKNYGDQLRGDVIADEFGNIYISSVTSSDDFPRDSANLSIPRTEFAGGDTDALVLKMDSELSKIEWRNLLGGEENDAAYSIKLDKDRNLFVAGGTSSPDFPTTASAYDKEFNGEVDGWISKIKSDGSALLASTYTGTSLFDQIYFTDLNGAEEVYVYGQTTSGEFPITPGIYNKIKSGQFLQKFKNDLSALEFSTVFGSGRQIPDISPTAFLVNDCGIIYMSGWAGGALNANVGGWNTLSFGLEVSADAFQTTTSGNDFYFLVLYDDAKKFLYGTFLGGKTSYTHVDGGTSRFDKRGTVYHAVCAGCQLGGNGLAKSDFPTTKGAWSQTNKSTNCNNAAFKFDLSSLRAIIQTNTPKRDLPGFSHVCMPDKIMFENKSIGGQIHEWDMGDGKKYTLNDTSAFLHEYKSEGVFLVKLKIIDERTCKGMDSTSTYLRVDRRIAQVQPDDDICFGERYQINASGGIAYAWTNEDGTFTSSLAQPLVSPKDTAKYYVTITEATGCVTKDSVTLNVIPGITPQFHFNRKESCGGKLIIDVENKTDSLKAEDVVYFDFGDGTTSDQQPATHEFQKEGVYQVRLITNRIECVVEQVQEIPMFKVIMPNVITPGINDDINDRLKIQFGETSKATPSDYGFKVSLTTYNRWGRILFHDDDYQYDWPNEDLSSGVYYYDVKVEGHGECKSWIHVIK